MDANLVYFVLGAVVSLITSIVANRYDVTFKGWSEKWRITKRLKKLEREKALYEAVRGMRGDAANREIYMSYLRDKMSCYLFFAAIALCCALLMNANIKPEFTVTYWLFNSPLPRPPTLVFAVTYWMSLLLTIYCANVGVLTFFKLRDLTWRLLLFNAYRERLQKEWPDSEWP